NGWEEKEIKAQHRNNGGHACCRKSLQRSNYEDGDEIEKTHGCGVHVDETKKHKRDRGDKAQRNQKVQSQASGFAPKAFGNGVNVRSSRGDHGTRIQLSYV